MSIRCTTVSYSYDGTRKALDRLSFTLETGSTLLVVGHNGAGKSTLLRLLNALLRPSEGMIEVNGRDTSLSPTAEMARSVCVTFQHPEDQIFSSTVLKEVTFGPANLRRPDPESLARRALALLGLEQLRTRHPYDLQPAERKLLTIASAVASDAPILAFDEPTVRLSQPERIILHRAFRTLQREGRTLLLVSHDLEFCLPLASQLLILSAGRCVFVGAAAEIWSRQSELRRAGVRIPLPVRIRPHLGLGETLPSPA